MELLQPKILAAAFVETMNRDVGRAFDELRVNRKPIRIEGSGIVLYDRYQTDIQRQLILVHFQFTISVNIHAFFYELL